MFVTFDVKLSSHRFACVCSNSLSYCSSSNNLSHGFAYYTIALTDEEIAVVANSRWRHRQPKRVERRYPAANNLHMSDEHAGDKRVRVGAMLQLWVIGRDLDEARRLCRLAGET